MKQTIAGISATRFQLRDIYLVIACQVCDVTPLEVMTAKCSSRAASTARKAIVWKLYTDGGLTQETAGALVGLKRNPAYRAINEVSFRLLYPKQHPLTVKVVEALNNI